MEKIAGRGNFTTAAVGNAKKIKFEMKVLCLRLITEVIIRIINGFNHFYFTTADFRKTSTLNCLFAPTPLNRLKHMKVFCKFLEMLYLHIVPTCAEN